MNDKPTNLDQLRERSSQTTALAEPGFGNSQAFELMIRQAKLLAASTLVPEQYRSNIVKLDHKGNIKSQYQNDNAIPNCVIALNFAVRMKADPLAVMQNLYIVEGRPSWSSQWVIASINQCGRFSPLRFEITVLGDKEATYTTYKWNDDTRQKEPSTQKVRIHDVRCVAYCIELATGEKLTGPAISIEMAVAEGWYTKNGSKWKTMPDLMLRYRAAAMFGRLYAPELLMGLPSQEEVVDTVVVEPGADGVYAPAAKTVNDLKQAPQPAAEQAEDAQPKATPAEQQATEPAQQEAPEKATAEGEPAQTGGLFGNVD